MPVKPHASNTATAPSPADDSTQRKLILAAIQTIERYGVDGATVRRIVAEAGVNIAAVNYHFGNKERLMEVVLETTIHEAHTKALVELEHAIALEGNVPNGTQRFLRDFLPSAFRYPRVAVAHLRSALIDQDYSGPGVTGTRRFVAGFQRLVAPAMKASAERQRLAVIHTWATIYGLALLPELFVGDAADYAGETMVQVLMGTLFG